VFVPGIPEAAYLASIPLKPEGPPLGSMGVSGGGGEPLEALVVALEAVLLNLFTPAGFGMLSAVAGVATGTVDPSGGG